MTFDRKEYTDHIGEKRKQYMNGQRSNMETALQQAVKADLLTGDEHWDTFLSYIQSAIDQAEEMVISYRSSLESPAMVDPNEVMTTRIALIAANNRIAAWNAVMELPKSLKEQGEMAEDWLSKLDG